MEDGAGGEAAFRRFHGAVSRLAAGVAAPNASWLCWTEASSRGMLELAPASSRTVAIMPKPSAGGRLHPPDSARGCTRRIAAAASIASSSPMMRDGLAEVIEMAASPMNVLRVEGMGGWL